MTRSQAILSSVGSLPPFDAFCVLLGQGKAIDNASFCAIQMRDDSFWPKYGAGDSVPIDFTTEPTVKEWGVVDAMFGETLLRIFGVIHRRDRRGVAVAIYRFSPECQRLHVHFVAAQRIIRVGWARPWDATGCQRSFMANEAWAAKRRAERAA